ncbi:hypothetical protein AA0472_2463 [Acetobacter estunensis NRIC 0472]|nr:Spy/CpxP family protein refolding chaperone [Acetobacter estunensis]GBQ27643.1 hypothetical protein AA0472_2463 [Acetobacter estunensis NRIC 0472]
MKRSFLAMIPMTMLAFGAVASGNAIAAPGNPPPPPMCGGSHGFPMLHGVDLTAEQKTSLKKIFKEGHESGKALHTQERTLHDQIANQLMTPGKIDRSQLDSLVQQQSALHAKEEAARIDTAVKIHDLLTTKQLTEAKDRQDKIKALMDQIHQIDHPEHDDQDD